MIDQHDDIMKQVLLVEDSPILRQSIKEMLNDCSNIVLDDFATTQQEAIRLLNTNHYDLMIVDIELAEGNGFEVVKHTMSEAYTQNRPTPVMLTNHTSRYYRLLAHQLNIKYFFDKSMDFEKAIETIEQETQD